MRSFKNIINKVILMALPLLGGAGGGLFSSCSDHEDWGANPAFGTGEEIELYGEIQQAYLTRVNDGGFVNADAIGVYIVDNTDGKPGELLAQGNHATNVKFTYNESNGSWTGSSKIYWTDKKTAIDAYSYYPFAEYIPNVSAHQFKVERRQDKDQAESNKALGGYEASDFLWAKAEGVAPGQTIQLLHHHAMASVRITLVEGDDFNGTWDSLDKSVIVPNTITNATINLNDGTASVLDGSAVEPITPYKKGNDWRCVVVPQTVEAGKTLISITVDGDSYSFTRETAMTYLPGRLHKFTIKVDKQMSGDYQFTLVDEAITAWEADDVSHQAEAKVYTVVHVPEVGGFRAAVEALGIDPSMVENLKLTGVFGEEDNNYLKEAFPQILSLNMKELRLKQMALSRFWYDEFVDGWGLRPDNGKIDYRMDDVIPFNFAAAYYSNGLDNLQHIVFPDSLKAIAPGAFPACQLSGRLELPEGLVWIGANAFYSYGNYRNHLTSLNLPSTLKYIGNNVFGGYDGKGLEFTNELILPEGLLYLGDGAFSCCFKMFGQIHIPESLVYLGGGALPPGLSGFAVIPERFKVIRGLPDKVTGVYIHDGVEEIEGGAFGSCLSGDIYIPNSVKKIGSGAFAGSKIKHVRLSERLEEISHFLFGECIYLQDTITIPEGVNRIYSQAFFNCRNLTAVVIPSTVEIIDERVFENCYSLDYLECKAINPPTLTGDPFRGVAKDNFTLVVPEESVEEYQKAEYWREFKRIAPYRNLVFRPQIAKVLNKGGERNVVLNCDAGKTWTVTHCPDWLHLSKTTGKGKTELKITIDKMAHGSADRKDEIVVQIEGTDITTSFKVSQFDYEYDEDQDFAIHTHNKGKGIDLVIVGDGYDAEDIANGTYLNDMIQQAEYFFGVEPYKTYKDYFNVYTAFAMSNESGIGSVNFLRDTKFQTSYGNGNYDSRISTFADMVAYYCLDNTPVTEDNFGKLTCILTANGSAYDGVTTMFANGTSVAICPKSDAPYPNDARGLVQHEACGHGFAKLADEYVYHNAYIDKCPCICCDHVGGLLGMQSQGWGLNVSLSGKAKDLPWQHLLKDWRTSDIVDVWEGGYYHARGVYRSEYNSCMNNNVPYFSTWSRELIVRRIMDYAGETYDYEKFIANDSREWGRDFTLGSRTPASEPTISAKHGAEPIIVPSAPSRTINRRRK